MEGVNESDPLLSHTNYPKSDHTTSTSSSNDHDRDIVNTTTTSHSTHLLYLLTKRAGPVCVGFIFMYLNNFITMAFAGHFSTVNFSGSTQSNVIFAGIALSIMYANVTFSSLMIGMSSAIDTLASQHYGAGNYTEVGIVLQRSCLVCLTVAFPLVGSWFFSQHLFLYLGVEKAVAEVVQTYLIVRSLGVPIDIISISYDKYLSAIGVVAPHVYANLVQNIVLVLTNFLLVVHFQFDYPALAIAWVLASLASLVTIVGMSISAPAVRATLQPRLSMRAWERWGEFMSLGLPATLMIISEWWAYEFLTLCASTLGTAEVAAQTVMMQTVYLCYMIPYGISSATSSLVGNFIGADKVSVAVRVGRLAVGVDFLCQLLIGVLALTYGKYMIESFTNDASIVAVAVQILPIVPFLTLCDGLSAVGAGVLRGAGKQNYGAVANLTSFYAVGLPSAIYLCFHTSLQVRGLMTGIALGSATQASFLIGYVLFGEKSLYTSSIDIGLNNNGNILQSLYAYNSIPSE